MSPSAFIKIREAAVAWFTDTTGNFKLVQWYYSQYVSRKFCWHALLNQGQVWLPLIDYNEGFWELQTWPKCSHSSENTLTVQQLKRNTRARDCWANHGTKNGTFQQPRDLSEWDNTEENRGSIKVESETWREMKGWVVLLPCNNKAHTLSLQVFLCSPVLQESRASSLLNPTSLWGRWNHSFCTQKTKTIILTVLSDSIQEEVRTNSCVFVSSRFKNNTAGRSALIFHTHMSCSSPSPYLSPRMATLRITHTTEEPALSQRITRSLHRESQGRRKPGQIAFWQKEQNFSLPSAAGCWSGTESGGVRWDCVTEGSQGAQTALWPSRARWEAEINAKHTADKGKLTCEWDCSAM